MYIIRSEQGLVIKAMKSKYIVMLTKSKISDLNHPWDICIPKAFGSSHPWDVYIPKTFASLDIWDVHIPKDLRRLHP